MIKSIIASTREIDDAQAAVAEILGTLDLEKNLLKNSLGIISCFSEFEGTGVLKAICDALPFDCIGATTCVCAVNGEIDQMIFVITVLTSDDCDFKTLSIPLHEDSYRESINVSVSSLIDSCPDKPALILSYFPLMQTLGGDSILEALDFATDKLPLFGPVAMDHTIDHSTEGTIHNGNFSRNTLVLGTVCGPVKVSFETAALNDDKIRKQKAVITKSKENILMGINGKTVHEYLTELGLDEVGFVDLIPFIVDNNDGTKPVARVVFTFTPEGFAVCGGTMPEGSTLSIGSVDAADVLMTAESAFKPFAEKDSVVIAYSCAARYVVLGMNVTKEAQILASAANDLNIHFAYSGGEICPHSDPQGGLVNCFHNYSIVFCKLV